MNEDLIARLRKQAGNEPAGVDTFYGRLFTEAASALEAAEARIASVRDESVEEWRPIETAPRDGREILVAGPAWNGKTADAAQYVAVVLWVRDAWRESDEEDEQPVWTPTHWRPLPAPPAPKQEGA